MATRVLIAEDDLHIVELLTFVLERERYAVSAVADGEAALARLRSDPPELLILDVMLPCLNGFEVLKALRADAKLKGLPVVVLTAKGQAQDRRTAEELGIDEFMTKPFSNREVVETLHRVLGRPQP
jgi:DNA-binding response OmpR family regulator